jgi:hypothetical protein
VPATDGVLVMADISGYTAFISGTEHEHSREILAELILNIANSFGGNSGSIRSKVTPAARA